MDCGGEYPPYVMDFDHRDPLDKTDNVANAVHNGWSVTKFRAEIAKCDVVCANCHRERTHRQAPVRRVRPEQPVAEQLAFAATTLSAST